MQWYYVQNGQQQGPVSEAELHSLVQNGTVKPGDLVWNASMGQQWAKASTIPALYPPAAGVPPVPAADATAAPAPASPFSAPEAGGLTPNRELMAQARQCLSGNWGVSVLVCFVMGLMINVAANFCCIGYFFVVGQLMVGSAIFFLALIRRGALDFGMLFSGFKTYGVALSAFLSVLVLSILWTLPGGLVLLLVGGAWMWQCLQLAVTHGAAPGSLPPFPQPALFGLSLVWIVLAAIWVGLRYSMTYFALADNPEEGGLAAVTRSKTMMKGNYGKLFCLNLRFIGWGLLCLLTCGIGFLWLMPYMQASTARFYDDLKAAGR